MRVLNGLLCLCMFGLLPGVSRAATFTVGPPGSDLQYTQLEAVFDDNDLEPGDVVEVEGNASYSGDIVVGDDDSGSAASPVIIRWRRAGGGSRPLLQGGINTIKFQQSNHVVLEGFEITGGSNSCVFSEAHNVTVRDVVIRDCASHGILAADQLSGSFTLEYSEIYNTGSSSNRHPIYMQSDEVAFPDSVFKMRFNYLHDGTGGNLVKVRHQRSEIYYNWLEGSAYQALELIGPDCWEQQAGWNTGLKREDADVVGNVIVQSGSWPNAIRIGGDLNGRSEGRVRLVNNTIVFTRGGTSHAVMAQLGAGSLEMHNNVVYQTTGGAPTLVKENVVNDTPEPCGPQSTSVWAAGRKVAGSYNWVQGGAVVPSEWTGTLSGSNPGLANVAQWNLRPLSSSVLAGAGANPPAIPSTFPFPSPLPLPLFDPPVRGKMAIGGERLRGLVNSRISMGAFEVAEGGNQSQFIRANGSQPMVRGSGTAATQVAAASTSAPVPVPVGTENVLNAGANKPERMLRNRKAGFLHSAYREFLMWWQPRKFKKLPLYPAPA